LGIPEERLDRLHQAIMDGKTVLLIHVENLDPKALQQRLLWQGAEDVLTLP
jgi:hypothetical protein